MTQTYPSSPSSPSSPGSPSTAASGGSTAEPVRFTVPSSGGVALAAYRWEPTDDPRGIVQLCHGMGEHALRYAPLAERLVADGYVVYAHDHRGHGATAGSPEALGLLGEGGWEELVEDIGRVGTVAQDAYPGLPLALVAHSMGSFAAQQFAAGHSRDISALVLSGTAAIDLMEVGMDLDSPMDLSAFNDAFQPPRTDFDWLTRDEAQVDAYIADPHCGFGIDVPGSKAMFAGARPLAAGDGLAGMRKDLPVYVVVGRMDPVNHGMEYADELIRRYEAAGLEDVTLVAYDGARHEVFNETNREEVFAGLVAWLGQRLG